MGDTKNHNTIKGMSLRKKMFESSKGIAFFICHMQRRLRSFEKKRDSIHRNKVDGDVGEESIDFTLQRPKNDDEQSKHVAMADAVVEESKEKNNDESGDNICIAENGFYLLPKSHPDYASLIKLQIENQVNFLYGFSLPMKFQ